MAFVFGNELFQRFLPLIPGTIGKVITKLLTGPYGRAIHGILKSTEALLNKLKDGTITREEATELLAIAQKDEGVRVLVDRFLVKYKLSSG